MNNVIVRSVSGIVYVALMVMGVIAGGVWLALLCIVLAVLGIGEFTTMTNGGKVPHVSTLIDILAGVALQLSTYWLVAGNFNLCVIGIILTFGLIWLRMISHLYSHNSSNPVNSLARSLMVQFYVSLPLAMMQLIDVFPSGGRVYLLSMLIFIWLNDTGAFCFGSMFGKRRLFERISPKKSWEGFAGGLVMTVIGALVMKLGFASSYEFISLGALCGAAILASVMATYGDLIESMIKRACGVKDSSHLIPGHGGILDRIDSILLVVPTSFAYLILVYLIFGY